MPIFNYPYIRDELEINQQVQDFYNGYVGNGPVYLIARKVKFASGCQFRVRQIPLVIVADEFDGSGGLIDARGNDSFAAGAGGAPGVFPNPATRPGPLGIDEPIAPGGDGGDGHPGGGGGVGGTVTVYCRQSVNVDITVAGGRGAQGGRGGNGSPGVHGVSIPGGTTTEPSDPNDPFSPLMTVEVPPIDIPGTPGGNGGGGGPGGPGGSGGVITLISVSDLTVPVLAAHGGEGGVGGEGGTAGVSGNFAGVDAQGGPTGLPGEPPGAFGTVTHTNVSEVDWVAGLRSVLLSSGGDYAIPWAQHRVSVGDFLYHRYNPSIEADKDWSRLAAIEFARALELHPDNADALRLQTQLVGTRQVDEATGSVVWVGGGNNALGFPPSLDVMPEFNRYMRPFAEFGSQVLVFLTQGTDALRTAAGTAALKGIVALEKSGAEAAHRNLNEDLLLAALEKQFAGEEAALVQRLLQQTMSEINVELTNMRDSPLTIGGFVKDVATVAGAVIGIAAAIPTFGTSLVALVPAVIALSDQLSESSDPIVQAMLDGKDLDSEDVQGDVKAVKEAYEKVDKKAKDVIGSGKKIVNLVAVIQRLNASTNAENAKHLALVKRAAELVHEVLLTKNKVALADQRLVAAGAKSARAAEIVRQAGVLHEQLDQVEDAFRHTGLLAINVAQSRTDALLTMAFQAQRSVEIYTLRPQEQNVHLDAGMLHPDIRRKFDEREIEVPQLHDALFASWSRLLQPIEMQNAYNAFFTPAPIQDRLRLSFGAADTQLVALRTTRRFNFRVDPLVIPAGRADAKVTDVKLALVGATNPVGEVSCEVRHGGAYEQRRADLTITTQLLKPLMSVRIAMLERLQPDETLGIGSHEDFPHQLPFWGRGIGGDWEVSVVAGEDNAELDLTGLTEIQVWIDYQFQ